MYAQKIEGDAWAGEKIDKGLIDKMSGECILHEIRANAEPFVSDQQLGQLYELMQAIHKKEREEGGDET